MRGPDVDRSEAKELRDSFDLFLPGATDRNEHVSSDDYQTEITAWLATEAHDPGGRDSPRSDMPGELPQSSKFASPVHRMLVSSLVRRRAGSFTDVLRGRDVRNSLRKTHDRARV